MIRRRRQPHFDASYARHYARRPTPRFNWGRFGTGYVLGLAWGLLALGALWWLLPVPRFNVLMLGLDRRPQETTYVSRTDLMMLVTVNPSQPYVGALSLPRDLWMQLPDGSSNRINTAHFFAEAQTPGTGPAAAMQTVRSNFGVTVDGYVRVDFKAVVAMIDALGGVEVDIPEPLIDYEYPTDDYGITTMQFEAGQQWLDGARAVAYARIRHGSSDFQRAERQGLVLRALVARALHPTAWPRWPLAAQAWLSSVSTDVPVTQWVLLLPSLLKVGPAGLDMRVIQGDMVQPFTTTGGASVQLPVWERINPVLLEMFGE